MKLRLGVLSLGLVIASFPADQASAQFSTTCHDMAIGMCSPDHNDDGSGLGWQNLSGGYTDYDACVQEQEAICQGNTTGNNPNPNPPNGGYGGYGVDCNYAPPQGYPDGTCKRS